MKIELKEITIRELTNNYKDNQEDGVIGYNGKLDIRPPFQREFVYNDKQRESVIDTIIRNFPLNVMYWSVKDDGNYEVIDGQQRTISICQYVTSAFSHNNNYFHNLTKDKQDDILNYKLMVYFCSGKDSEKLEWFRIINIAGVKLTEQELRNAVYSGSWVTDAKRYFSKANCVAYGLSKDYMNGVPIRQDYLETTIKWISKGNIEDYMAKHQHDINANELWFYFSSVINWVTATFNTSRKEMKGVDWGELYNSFKGSIFDTVKLEQEISNLMKDEDVTNKKGIYFYVLNRNEKYLNIRAFSDNQKREAYERQNGICPITNTRYDIKEMEADHIIAWSKGGKTDSFNCQMVSIEANRHKGNR